MSENKHSQRPKNWAEVDARVRKRIVNLLRGEVLGARDQAERFRDPGSKHANEAIALQWDEQARIYRDALELFKADIRRPPPPPTTVPSAGVPRQDKGRR